MSTVAATLPSVPTRPLSNTAYVVILLLLPAVCLLAGVLDAEVALAYILLAMALTIVLRKTQSLANEEPGLIPLFFASAAVHAVIGYWMAPAASIRIWIGNAAPQFYAISFLVIASGLISAAAGYALSARWQFAIVRRTFARFEADDSRFLLAARVFVVTGAIMMIVIYARMDFAPLLTASPGQARYFTSVMGDEYALSEWLVSRALDLLMFGVPLLFLSRSWYRRRSDLVLATVGFVVMLLPLRRANALSVPFVLLVVGALRSGKVAAKRALVAVVLIAAYALSQLLLSVPGDLDLQSSLASLGTALPEVRDLGWTIELLESERLNGSTFAQALTPIPSFASDFSKRSSLRAVTSRLIGLDAQRTTGGLRLTLAGEAFLNFDHFGPVLLGFSFGIVCSMVQTLAETLRRKQKIWACYFAAVAFVWLCFWVYLGGTQAAATVKVGALLLGISLFFARTKGVGPEVPA